MALAVSDLGAVLLAFWLAAAIVWRPGVGINGGHDTDWLVLLQTAAVKPAQRTPVDVVGKQIKQTLVQNKKNEEMNAWVAKIQKSYCKGGQIKYQAGYQPSPDPCASLATATNTTTTG